MVECIAGIGFYQVSIFDGCIACQCCLVRGLSLTFFFLFWVMFCFRCHSNFFTPSIKLPHGGIFDCCIACHQCCLVRGLLLTFFFLFWVMFCFRCHSNGTYNRRPYMFRRTWLQSSFYIYWIGRSNGWHQFPTLSKRLVFLLQHNCWCCGRFHPGYKM